MTSNEVEGQQVARDVARANLMLPLVRTISAEVVALSKEVYQTRERLEEVSQSRNLKNVSDMYGGELESVQEAILQTLQRRDECIDELVSLGVATSGREDVGYVDFHATRNGEAIHLCWNHKDATVGHWHFPSQTCEHRKPLSPEVIRNSLAGTAHENVKPTLLA